MIANNAAAENGREGCLRVLHELGGDAAASLAAADVLEHGHTPAHLAAEWGHDRAACACCTSWGATQRLVWRQHQIVPRPPTLPLCAGTRAVCACAARAGRRCAAASLAAARHVLPLSWPPGRANGNTPAHLAAECGHKGPLRVLHELGGDAAARAWLVVAANADGQKPAHLAAGCGHPGCLGVLHELGAATRGQLGGSKSRWSDARPPCPCRCHHRWR